MHSVIFGGTGSQTDTIYNYVDNNSWQVTVYFIVPPDPPTNLFTTPYTTQVQLSWTNNSANDSVIIAYNTNNTFGTPINGTSYSLNNAIAGGGTILFQRVFYFLLSIRVKSSHTVLL